MSSDAPTVNDSAPLRDRVVTQLETHVPPAARRQVTIRAADPEAGTVVLSFGCGCSGGLSDPAKSALRANLVENLHSVDDVSFESGCGCGGGHGGRGGESSDSPEAPF